MKTNKLLIDTYIDRLSKIAVSIKMLYDKLNVELNEDKIKELNNYLDIALNAENNIYQEIDEDILLSNQFFNRVTYLLQNQDLKFKDQIENRITRYLASRKYLNPFLSTLNHQEDKEEENSAIIRTQFSLDYTIKVFAQIEEELNNQNIDLRKKCSLITAKNNTLFANKILLDLTKEQLDNFDGRKRCITFKHNKDVISSFYRVSSLEIINLTTSALLNHQENIYTEIELKAALKLLNREELFEIIKSYYENTTKHPLYKSLAENNPNHQLIIKIINNAIDNFIETSKKRK